MKDILSWRFFGIFFCLGVFSLQENVQAIVGGEVAAEKFPFVVMLMKKVGNTFRPQCSGTLISKNEIVSAAHCFGGGEWWVYVGAGKVQASDQIIPQGKVSRLEIHPRFLHSMVGMNDLALAEVEWKSDSNVVLPEEFPQLPTWWSHELTIKEATIVGFGQVERTAPMVGIKRYATMNIVKVTSAEWFAAKAGVDSCNGDSGGPLLWREAEDKPWTLIGVASTGFSSQCRHGGRWAATAESSCFLYRQQEDNILPLHCQHPLKAPLPPAGTELEELDLRDQLISDFSPLLEWPKSLKRVNVAFNLSADQEVFKELQERGVEVIGAKVQDTSYAATPFLKRCNENPDDEEVIKIQQRLLEDVNPHLKSCDEFNAALLRSVKLDLTGLHLKSGELLMHLPRLIKLNLTENELGEGEMDFLHTMVSLRQVDFSWNPICEKQKMKEKEQRLPMALQWRCEKENERADYLKRFDFYASCLDPYQYGPERVRTVSVLEEKLRTPGRSCLQATAKLLRQRQLHLRKYFLKDLNPLRGLPNLEYLDLRDNDLLDSVDKEILKSLPKLKKVKM